MKKRFVYLLALSAVTAHLLCLSASEPEEGKVSLVVQITVDQFRGDIPLRFKNHFGPNGFRYLMEQGVYYTNVHYQHSTTVTAVGHATLFTGGHTAQHGIVGNDWIDLETGRRVACVEDDRHTVIGEKAKAHKGTSPRNLTSSTIGDELVLASGGKSRVFNVSFKDRAAIIQGGHLGKAFWFSKSSGEFVSSTYYYDDYPEWVVVWNKAKRVDKFRDQPWVLMDDKESYFYSNADDRPFEKSYKKLGRTFPHALNNVKDEVYYGTLTFTPFGDELTQAFAKGLIRWERLGQGDAIDMLSISFSSTDRIGHAFGPQSLEYEDNVLRLDALLADLFAYIDETVGLDRTVIVLSSDHGTDEIPEFKQSLGFEAGRHYPKQFIESANAALQRRFNSIEDFILAFWNPGLYLNLETVQKLGLDPVTIEKALAEEMLKVPGIAYAVTRSDLLTGNVANIPIMHRVQRAFHPKRSGNVIIIQDQFWYLHPKAETYSAMHGSPYSYDTYVPIMLTGPSIKPKMVHRQVAPSDIAPSLASYLGIKPPSGSAGTPLVEMLDDR